MSEGKESKDDLLKRMKSMSDEELKQYYTVVSALNTALNFGGVLLIWFILANPTVGIVVGGGLLLYFLASTGANTTNFKVEILKMLSKDK